MHMGSSFSHICIKNGDMVLENRSTFVLRKSSMFMPCQVRQENTSKLSHWKETSPRRCLGKTVLHSRLLAMPTICTLLEWIQRIVNYMWQRLIALCQLHQSNCRWIKLYQTKTVTEAHQWFVLQLFGLIRIFL